MTVRELATILQELPPDATVVLDATFAQQGKPVMLRRVHITNGSLALCDHYLTVAPNFEFTSFDGQVYIVSYDGNIH